MDHFLSLAVNVSASFMIPNTRLVLHLVLLSLKRTFLWPTNATISWCGRKADFHIAVHHVFSHGGHARNECADTATSLVMRGFVAESNVLVAHHLFGIPHCLTRIAVFLHSVIVDFAVGMTLCLFQVFFSLTFQLRGIWLCALLLSDSPIPMSGSRHSCHTRFNLTRLPKYSDKSSDNQE